MGTDDAAITSAGRLQREDSPFAGDSFERVTVDGQPTDIGPGEALCIPRGAVHRFENNGAEDAKVLAVVTPGILGPDYFRDVAAVIDASAGGPPDRSAIGEVMLRHGLTPAPPA